MKTAKVWYFKDTGKFYSEDSFEYTDPDYAVGKIAERLLDSGQLPGLVEGAKFHVVVIGADEIPRLVLKNPLRDIQECLNNDYS